MRLYWQSLRDLAQRYRQVFAYAWSIRDQLESPQRQRDELAFLPAHLELAETPVHPAPQWALRLLMAFSLLALLWSVFGKLDIVATAHGKLEPDVMVKVIQPMDTGIVRTIQVQDGQRVQAGQLLLELDPTQAQADAGKTRAALLDANLAAARAEALLASLQNGKPPRVAPIDGEPTIRQQEAQHFVEGQFAEYQQKTAANQSELFKRQAELQTAQVEIAKLQQTVPMARQVAQSYAALLPSGDVSRQEYLEKQQTYVQQQHDLLAQQSHVQELRAATEEQRRSIDATRAEFQRDQLDALNQAQQALAQSQQEAAKAIQRQQRTRLLAPVSGTVQQLAVHTVGGVVTTAQSLMEIVPDDTLEVEAQIENKDIGFVYPGQPAEIKIATFPYTRYGTLPGKVIRVSNDASQDKKLGLVFKARIRLQTNRIRVENKWINLTPGMEVTADIKTGKRRVIEYFLSPLVEYTGESFRER
ncbi:HlyD family type I secretion periplasmic adaptor subunit [Paludibacterium purpuratum]|uniref:Membrane fusion protein (MFP) family protein n=1 Tax=Paludibacterium purpuratum TaxID=1144873 RepID=A0A4R7B342_9NEIS|nr:HlyD family type I secretion periplasmic adaptor subunit [Paludibacterium purpuratum]TDR76423.1 hemolysin D [Paludibacterium purpuratum]